MWVISAIDIICNMSLTNDILHDHSPPQHKPTQFPNACVDVGVG